jgi:hypothetical protein
METHKLMDENNPKCLYCNSNCDVSGWGSGMQWGNDFTCQQCGEVFQTEHSEDSPVGGFMFSCDKIKIYHDYANQKFGLIKIDPKSTAISWVPEFDINFADKEAFYQKIKTYLIFS